MNTLEAADYWEHSYAPAHTLSNLAALADLGFLVPDIDLTHFGSKVTIHERKIR